MCQVIDYFHVHCQHTFRYRLVNRCATGFSPTARCCKANENQVIGERPFYRPRWCTGCRDVRARTIQQVYEIYEKEAHAEGERQGWSDQMIRSVIERVRRDRYKEEYNFSLALAEVEDREESASTMNWPRDLDCLDDSEFEEHGQKLSDDEENRAVRDDSSSENWHSVSSAEVGSGDESSEPEAEALPHFGFFRSSLRGRGPELEVWSDVSSDGEEPIDHAGFDTEDGCDSDDPDRMDICDSEDSGVGNHHNSATDVSYDHRGYMVDDEDRCDEPEGRSDGLDDDLDGYEADIEDSCDHSNSLLAVNYDGSGADIKDNCFASEDEFNHETQAMVVD